MTNKCYSLTYDYSMTARSSFVFDSNADERLLFEMCVQHIETSNILIWLELLYCKPISTYENHMVIIWLLCAIYKETDYHMRYFVCV